MSADGFLSLSDLGPSLLPTPLAFFPPVVPVLSCKTNFLAPLEANEALFKSELPEEHTAPALRNKHEAAGCKSSFAISCQASFRAQLPRALLGRCKVQFTIKVSGTGQVGLGCPALSLWFLTAKPSSPSSCAAQPGEGKVNADLI